MRRWLTILLATGCAALAGCGDDSGGAGDAGADTDADSDSDADADAGADGGTGGYDFAATAPWYLCQGDGPPAGTTVATVFDQEYQYFGDEDRRTVVAEAELPSGEWAQVGLWFHLECPESGNCDIWDRMGSVRLVLNPEDDQAEWQYVELLRHITPYDKEMCQFVDVTPLAGLLWGTRTFASFIDTWVGPDSGGNGEGWRVTVRLVYFPGEEAAGNEVIDVWGDKSVTVGEPDAGATVDDQTEPFTVDIPAEATQVLAHLTTTGHSFGNTGNCAEFCQMRQDLYVNDTLFSVNPWRDDCEQNPTSPQNGTWQYDRNGWCPGAVSVGQIVDVTDAVYPGAANELDFDIRLANGNVYVNENPQDWLPNELVSLHLYVR